ncbi:hypothetical protein P4H65_21865 [Paenibacillus chitinolyticus]|nr:hypothetical protein [Paenibacillus chitinolyticus]MEC0248454.1 hypothetical protein [Paenibacillus chitinolyticus]
MVTKAENVVTLKDCLNLVAWNSLPFDPNQAKAAGLLEGSPVFFICFIR